MSKFNQKEFNQFIVEQGILGFFEEPIKLVSGRLSSWYVNWRNVAGDAYLLDKLSDFVLAYIKEKNINPDCIYGVPEGATKLGVITQYKWAKSQKDFGLNSHCLAMGRKVPKDHGEPKDRFFVGAPKGKVVIIEDVTNTGGSLIKTVDSLQNQGISIVAAMVLTHRNMKPDGDKTIKEILGDKGVNYFYMSDALTLLPEIVKVKKPSNEVKKAVEEEFRKWGEHEINLQL